MAVERKRTTSSTAVHTAPSEWRWVIIMSAVLLVLISIPLAWASWVDRSQPDVAFAGILSNPLDGATYLAKIQLGTEGEWRTSFRHTPGGTQGAFVSVLYNGLGQFSRYLSLSNVFTYHASRLLTSILMFLAIYQLGTVIWRRQRTRRMFFITAVVGSGLGWLVVLFGVQTPDLVIPEAYPLYSAFTNVHFPLAIALLAVIAGVFVMAFRPGFSDDPTVQNGGLTVILSSFLLALIAPHALVPLPLAAAAVIAVDWVRRRKIYVYQFRWFMLLVLPAVPVAGYYVAEMRYNDAVGLWMAQNVTLTPLPHIFLAGFALPLIVALPAIIRAVRNYEPDGDQFMLWWLIAFLVMVYVPTSAQRRFAIGMMLPIAYFAVRALNDYWLHDRKEKVKGRLLAAFYGLSGISYVLLFLLWFQAAGSTTDPRFYLNDGYFRAFSWLQREADDDAVVLASEAVGLWVPGHAGMSTVYGHPYETLLADVRQQDVRDWYAAGSAADAICTSLVERDNVQYVVVGPLERPDGATPACIETLTEVQQFGDVTLYEP
ncbi:MAG: hypothetical protein AAFU54_21820 [Chloroflexota bacterium]